MTVSFISKQTYVSIYFHNLPESFISFSGTNLLPGGGLLWLWSGAMLSEQGEAVGGTTSIILATNLFPFFVFPKTILSGISVTDNYILCYIHNV